MDDARPLDAGDGAERLALRLCASDECVDQGPAFMPRAGMHHHAGRLVHDQHRGILVGHPERDHLGLDAWIARSRQDDADLLTAGQPIAGARPLPIDQRTTVADQPLGVRAADACQSHHRQIETA